MRTSCRAGRHDDRTRTLLDLMAGDVAELLDLLAGATVRLQLQPQLQLLLPRQRQQQLQPQL